MLGHKVSRAKRWATQGTVYPNNVPVMEGCRRTQARTGPGPEHSQLASIFFSSVSVISTAPVLGQGYARCMCAWHGFAWTLQSDMLVAE